MIRRPPRSTRTDTLFPYTTLFRSYPLARKLPLRAAAGDGGVWTAVHPSQNSKLQEKARPEPRFPLAALRVDRSEEHTSELQSLMRNSYAVFCLKKKNINQQNYNILINIHNSTTQMSTTINIL